MLVGDEGWMASLPLAASGPGEPFATAAGVLGLMVSPRVWSVSALVLYMVVLGAMLLK